MDKRFVIGLYFIFFCSILYAQIPNSPKREVRAVWLTTIGGLDWPHSYARSKAGIDKQKRELCTLLDMYQKAGINTVLIQTRVRGTVIYPSLYEPWDGCLSGNPGVSPGYDALGFAVEECHRRGMELHAWIVTIPLGKWDKLGAKAFRKKYPTLVKKIGADGYMDPENPLTAGYLAEICGEIAENYNVDGIHLDYIRYPETWNIKVPREQGRAYITNIVRQISQSVKSRKPWIKVSCSPIGKFDDLRRYRSNGWNAYTRVCQDAQGWLRNGLMDQLYPMMYFRNDQFYPFAIDWAEQSHSKTIAPGLGIYFLNPREGNWRLEDITRQMQFLRHYGLGQTFFRGKFLTDNERGIYDFVKQFNSHPALVPAMTWQSDKLPPSPHSLQLYNDGMEWKGDTPYYNIYSSRTWPVDTDRPENLIAIRRTTTSIAIKTEGRYFAVTAMDEYGNESKPIQSHTLPQPKTIDIPLLKCDGKRLSLPERSNVLDARLLTIETLQGSRIETRIYQNSDIDISRLPDGYYILKSLGKKGVTHRLGYFYKGPKL